MTFGGAMQLKKKKKIEIQVKRQGILSMIVKGKELEGVQIPEVSTNVFSLCSSRHPNDKATADTCRGA